jgi:hypothetical protein
MPEQIGQRTRAVRAPSGVIVAVVVCPQVQEKRTCSSSPWNAADAVRD